MDGCACCCLLACLLACLLLRTESNSEATLCWKAKRDDGTVARSRDKVSRAWTSSLASARRILQTARVPSQSPLLITASRNSCFASFDPAA